MWGDTRAPNRHRETKLRYSNFVQAGWRSSVQTVKAATSKTRGDVLIQMNVMCGMCEPCDESRSKTERTGDE
jgi:hypothetical protein